MTTITVPVLSLKTALADALPFLDKSRAAFDYADSDEGIVR